MTINGKISEVTWNDERARSNGGHSAVILSGELLASQGELPVGLLLARNVDFKLIPWGAITGLVIGTGDGSTKAFDIDLGGPVEPGAITVTDGTETFTDNGRGTLTGDAGGSGSINYDTGLGAVSFNANVTALQDVTLDYTPKIAGVLDEWVDTSKAASGLYIPHGSVRQDVLKVGAVTPQAPSLAQLKKLVSLGIYPE